MIESTGKTQVTARELAVLAGLKPEDFTGYVLIMVPSVGGYTSGEVPVLVTDAPDAGSVIYILGCTLGGLGESLAYADTPIPPGRDDEG